MKEKVFITQTENFFLALADKTRLRLLNLMKDGEVCVLSFTEVLGESQPKISRHLAYLRNAGLVEARRDGKWMHYKIVEPEIEVLRKILQEILEGLRNQPDLKKEYTKLHKASYNISHSAAIEKAPEPNIFVDTHAYQPREELETFLL